MNIRIMRKLISTIFFLLFSQLVHSEIIKPDSKTIDTWRESLKFFLDKNQIPLIDMETTLSKSIYHKWVPKIFPSLEKEKIALTAADGGGGVNESGYKWSNYILENSQKYPSKFIPTTDGGFNKNWKDQNKGPNSFIAQLEKEVASGKYFVIGEIEFKHYMSNRQCKKGLHHRFVDIDIESEFGHRVFNLSNKYSLPLVIHLEMEDDQYSKLERMLRKYPKANIVIAHFAQLRNPDFQTKFTIENISLLLERNQNLFFDLANPKPNKKFKCSGPNQNETTYITNPLWAYDGEEQIDKMDSDWILFFEKYSDRFVFASDFGSRNRVFDDFLENRVYWFHRLTENLSEEARHNISYRNAWKLITKEIWSNN